MLDGWVFNMEQIVMDIILKVYRDRDYEFPEIYKGEAADEILMSHRWYLEVGRGQKPLTRISSCNCGATLIEISNDGVTYHQRDIISIDSYSSKCSYNENDHTICDIIY